MGDEQKAGMPGWQSEGLSLSLYIISSTLLGDPALLKLSGTRPDLTDFEPTEYCLGNPLPLPAQKRQQIDKNVF